MSSLAFLASEAADTSIVCHSDQVLFCLSDPQDQKSLMHRWDSCSGRGNKGATIVFTYNNSLYNPFGRMLLYSPLFAEYVKPKIVDAPLIVLATVPDHHFGSGSGSKPNRCQIGGPGRQ